jgi:hypothetical protein
MSTTGTPDPGSEDVTPDEMEILRSFQADLGELSDEVSARMWEGIQAGMVESPLPKEALSESPKAEDLLDAVFRRAMHSEDVEAAFKNLPDHLAVHFLVDPDAGMECVQILNWETKDRFILTRPTLDFASKPDLTTPITGEEDKMLYRLIRQSMFEVSFHIEMLDDSENDLLLHEIMYDVLPDELIAWGVTDEPRMFDTAKHGSDSYRQLLDSVLEDSYIEKLAAGTYS